jgi:Rod binding domain-containing protein
MNSITATSAVGAGDEATPQPRLVRAAHEFEAQMMKELMKPLTWDNSLTGADKDSDGGTASGGALGEFASEALGRALSERGGFGIADGVVKELSHSVNSNATGKVIGNMHGNTKMRASK